MPSALSEVTFVEKLSVTEGSSYIIVYTLLPFGTIS